MYKESDWEVLQRALDASKEEATAKQEQGDGLVSRLRRIGKQTGIDLVPPPSHIRAMNWLAGKEGEAYWTPPTPDPDTLKGRDTN